MNLSAVPGAIIALTLLGLAVLVLGGLAARTGKGAAAAVGKVI